MRLTPAQFAELCETNPEAVLQLEPDGRLVTLTPTAGITGARNGTLVSLLWLAARQARLPDGSVRSPDAAVVTLDRSRATGCGDAVAGKGAPRDRGTLGALRNGLPETLPRLVDCLD